MNQAPSCKNCRYYSQHYSKREIRFDTVACGHCLHPNMKTKKLVLCEFWENNAVRKEERKTAIKETLENMARNLESIAILLKDDSEIL